MARGLNLPVDAPSFQVTYPTLLQRLGRQWIDPTTCDTYSSICQLYNREYQVRPFPFLLLSPLSHDRGTRVI